MSAAPARRSVRTVATREKLYAAAVRLIGERGFDQVTVDEIAAAAGVAKGTVYYNFPSKELLIEGLLENRLKVLVGSLTDLQGLPHSGVHQIVDTLIRFVTDNASVAQLVVAEMWRTSSRWHRVLGEARAELIDVLEQVVETSRTQGDRGPRSRTVAVGLLATCLTVGLDWQVYTPGRPPSELQAQIALLFDFSKK